MIRVHAAIQLDETSPVDAFTIISQTERTFRHADRVEQISILPGPDLPREQGDSTVSRATRWKVLLNGAPIMWTQKEAIRDDRIRFEQISGDFADMRGQWSVQELPPGACQVAVRFRVELGVDGLAPLIEPIWAQSFQAHALSLLRAVAARAEQHKD